MEVPLSDILLSSILQSSGDKVAFCGLTFTNQQRLYTYKRSTNRNKHDIIGSPSSLTGRVLRKSAYLEAALAALSAISHSASPTSSLRVAATLPIVVCSATSTEVTASLLGISMITWITENLSYFNINTEPEGVSEGR